MAQHMPRTNVIELDGSSWQTKEDFYLALLSALGAPEWHGHNLDAMEETLRGGDINRVNPPLSITFFGSQEMGAEAIVTARRFIDLCDDLANDGVPIDAAMAVG
jgi:RNAse (barnase) inhibitor barstar